MEATVTWNKDQSIATVTRDGVSCVVSFETDLRRLSEGHVGAVQWVSSGEATKPTSFLVKDGGCDGN